MVSARARVPIASSSRRHWPVLMAPLWKSKLQVADAGMLRVADVPVRASLGQRGVSGAGTSGASSSQPASSSASVAGSLKVRAPGLARAGDPDGAVHGRPADRAAPLCHDLPRARPTSSSSACPPNSGSSVPPIVSRTPGWSRRRGACADGRRQIRSPVDRPVWVGGGRDGRPGEPGGRQAAGTGRYRPVDLVTATAAPRPRRPHLGPVHGALRAGRSVNSTLAQMSPASISPFACSTVTPQRRRRP